MYKPVGRRQKEPAPTDEAGSDDPECNMTQVKGRAERGTKRE